MDMMGKMKKYVIRKIGSPTEIETCERAGITQAQWRNVVSPGAWAYLGYLEGKGLFSRLACEETNPHRVHVYHKAPVWKDSALELFLAFPVSVDKTVGTLTNESLYLNFEVNANGAMYAKYGYGKTKRDFVPDQVYRESRCNTVIGRSGWRADFLVPEWYLEEVTGRKLVSWLKADEGGQMYCNFFKISESPEIEHYLSFSEVGGETPNFHQPVYFAEAAYEE